MTRAKLHSLTGVVPVLGYVLVHSWETGAAVGGRRHFADALMGGSGSALALAVETAVVLVPLAIHAGLGVAIVVADRESDDAGSFPSRGLRTVQRVTGAIALLFVLAHLSHGWMLKLGGADAAFVYDALRDELGRPLWLVTYVIGISCVCVHAAQGVAASAKTWQLVSTDAGARALRVTTAALATALWLVSINTLSHFAVGRPIFWGHTDTGVEAPRDGAER